MKVITYNPSFSHKPKYTPKLVLEVHRFCQKIQSLSCSVGMIVSLVAFAIALVKWDVQLMNDLKTLCFAIVTVWIAFSDRNLLMNSHYNIQLRNAWLKNRNDVSGFFSSLRQIKMSVADYTRSTYFLRGYSGFKRVVTDQWTVKILRKNMGYLCYTSHAKVLKWIPTIHLSGW